MGAASGVTGSPGPARRGALRAAPEARKGEQSPLSASRKRPNDRYHSATRKKDYARGIVVQSILIVEDSATMRALIAASLEELEIPVKITEADSGFEALRYLPRDHFDLVVTDINMPDINGLELVSFIKKNDRYSSIPLVIVSTERSDRDRDKGLGLGADAYLVKPFEPETLRQVVRDLLARPRREP